MSLVAQTIPNLVSGVSQQPSPSRLTTSGEKMNNAFPSVVSGLMKRAPTEFVAELSPAITVPDHAAVHVIDRDLTEKYILVVGSGDLELYDAAGTKQTVTFPDGKAYLPTTDVWKKMRFVTVADTTFCLNTEKTVAAESLTDSRTDPKTRATVFVKQAIPSVTYAFYINGSLAGSFSTSDNTTASTALEGTAEIAAGLASDCVSRGYTVSRRGPVLSITVTSGDVIRVNDEFGGNAMEVYTETVQSFDRLPPLERDNRVVKIQDFENRDNPYWVQYNEETNSWQETYGYDDRERLDASTMPHVLVKTGANTFEFRENTWEERSAGDATTNPSPSYVGTTINGMFLFKGRLGLLGGENMVLSKVGNFEQQYRTTVLQILAEDVIDVASVTGRVNTLYHAVAFADELLLLSDKQQFRVNSGDVFAADTVGITPSTSYPASPYVSPVNVGNSAYFVGNGPTHTVAREIYIDVNRQTIKADDIAVQVPTYIPLDIRAIAGSSSASAFLAVAESEPNVIYVHKWYEINDDKVQSAWCKWVFDENVTIVGMGFLEEVLYLVYKVGSDVRIDKMLVGPTIDKDLLLDHQFTEADCTVSYSAGTGLTTIDIPYGTASTVEFYRTDDGTFSKITATRSDEDTYTVEGDITSYEFTGGLNYEFLYEFSTQYIREETQGGESTIQDGRLQLHYMSLIYQGTSYFTVEVTPKSNTTNTYTFSGRILGDEDATADGIPSDTGEFKFPVFAENTAVTIQLKNDKPYKCSFGSVEWLARFRQKAKRF